MDELSNAITAVSSLLALFCNSVSTVILLVTAFLVHRELREARQANYATAYKMALDILQSEDVRRARGIVMKQLATKQFNTWDEEAVEEARKVCQSYDAVAQMIRAEMLPLRTIADSWGPSLRESWRILSPMVMAFRAEVNATEYWDDFEWLAKQAGRFQKPIYSKR